MPIQFVKVSPNKYKMKNMYPGEHDWISFTDSLDELRAVYSKASAMNVVIFPESDYSSHQWDGQRIKMLTTGCPEHPFLSWIRFRTSGHWIYAGAMHEDQQEADAMT